MYEEPLLQQTRQEEERYGNILHKRSSTPAQQQPPVKHNDGAYTDEKDSVDLGAMIHQLNSYYALLWHVSLTMICARCAHALAVTREPL